MDQQTCPKCGGRGLIIVSGDTARICSCASRVKINNLVKSSHMTEELRKKTFAGFSLEYYSKTMKDPLLKITHYEIAVRSLETCKSFVKDCLTGKNPRGLYIFGEVGSGKTHLACSIANELIKGGMEVLFVVVSDYLEEIKYSWEQGSDYNEKEILDRAREVAVLVMDDLGAHSYSDWTKGKIYSILNRRINNNLPTVITSNLEYHEIEDYLDHRISSRITELCRPVLLMVDKNEHIRLQKLTEATHKQCSGTAPLHCNKK
ncbi:MAG: ATP-binding protein [Peptococcaceae bacterium]|nr:ATP-binding protein [Peptococcaceae bacterium]